MPISVTEAPPTADGTERFMWRASAGEGQKVGWALTRADAEKRGERALRHLHAVESHTPEELALLEAGEGHVALRAPDGTVVEVDERVMGPLLAAGYTEAHGEVPQRTNEQPGPVEVAENPRRRGKTAQVPDAPRDEM